MKITIAIDTTPEEMRTFFGLPDLGPLQQQWLSQLQEQMQKGVSAFDPSTMMMLNPALAGQMKLFEAMQKSFWQQFGSQTDSKPA